MFNTWFYRINQQLTPIALTFFIVGHLFQGLGPYSVLASYFWYVGLALSVAINFLMMVHIAKEEGWVKMPFIFKMGMQY